jgi:hypothetical protein
MKKLIFFISILFLMGCKVSGKEKKGLIIPAYFYNTTLWNRVASVNSDEIVIINPSSGPGKYVDNAYEKFINNLVSNGKKPIGYVYTKWSKRDISLVKKDIDTWISFYPKIKGFFIDEANSAASYSRYYKVIVNYIKSKGGYFVVLNPGTIPDSVYFSIGDNVVVYEGNVFSLPDNICSVYSNKSSIIVYNASEAEMKKIADGKSCRYLYITDDNLPNPYDNLPNYFDKENQLLK